MSFGAIARRNRSIEPSIIEPNVEELLQRPGESAPRLNEIDRAGRTIRSESSASRIEVEPGSFEEELDRSVFDKTRTSNRSIFPADSIFLGISVLTDSGESVTTPHEFSLSRSLQLDRPLELWKLPVNRTRPFR
jgi:hypothetical protein